MNVKKENRKTQKTKSPPKWDRSDPDKYRAQARRHMRAYRSTPEGRRSARAASKNYRTQKRHRFNASRRKWLRGHPSARIGDRLSTLLRSSLKAAREKSKFWDITGWSLDHYRRRLENQWEPDMTWANFGSGWCVNLIIPKRCFDLTKPEEVRRCFHLDNVRPAWKEHVVAKGGRFRWVYP